MWECNLWTENDLNYLNDYKESKQCALLAAGIHRMICFEKIHKCKILIKIMCYTWKRFFGLSIEL